MIKSQLSGIQTIKSLSNMSCLQISLRNLSLSSSVQLVQKAKVVPSGIPKKPATPWVNFYSKNFQTVKKSNPNLATAEIMRKISTEWAKVGEKEKEKMQALYVKDVESFKKKMEKVPQHKLEDLKIARKIKQTEKEVRVSKQERKNLLISLNKPKKPLSSFFLYTIDRRPQLPTNLSAVEKTSKMAKEWRDANKQLKDFYEKKQAELAKKHEKDLEKWNMKMHKEGKLEEIAEAEKSLARAKQAMRQVEA